jgi:hypothetical protein
MPTMILLHGAMPAFPGRLAGSAAPASRSGVTVWQPPTFTVPEWLPQTAPRGRVRFDAVRIWANADDVPIGIK